MRHLLAFMLAAAAVLPAAGTTVDYTAYFHPAGDLMMEDFQYDCDGYNDVVVKGDLAFTVSRHGFYAFDVSNPREPVQVGSASLPDARRCAIRDHYLYVATENQVVAIADVEDAAIMPVVGELTFASRPADLVVLGSWLYVLRNGGELRVFSLADPAAPQLVTTLALPLGGATALVGEGGLLLAASSDDLVAVDVSVPEWPSVRGTLELGSTIYGLDLRGGLALVAAAYTSYLVDVSEPEALHTTATLDVSGAGALLTSNGQAWVGTESCWHQGGMRIYDVSDPAAPVWLHDEIDSLRGFPWAMFEWQGYVYAAEYFCWCAGEWPAFHSYKLGELPPPSPLVTQEIDRVYGLIADGSRFHVARLGGLETWDASSPQDPQLLQSIAEADAYWLLAADDDLLITIGYGQAGASWLQVLTRTADGLLELDGELPLPDYPLDIDVSGDLAVLAFDEERGAWFVDLSDRDQPVQVGSMFEGTTMRSAAIDGDVLAASFGLALRIFDISDLQAPVQTAILDAPVRWRDHLEFATRDGRRLLLAARNGSLFETGGFADVFDLDDPSAPEWLAQIHELPQFDVVRVALAEDLLVVEGTDYLSLYRWTSLADQPALLGRVELNPGQAGSQGTHLAITETALVTADWTYQASKFQLWPLPAGTVTAAADRPPRPARLQLTAAPNPFNPACELRFSLSLGAPVDLDLFDLRGRRVRRLLHATLPAGDHAARWNGRGDSGAPVAAGVYLARLRAGTETAVVKLTLVE